MNTAPGHRSYWCAVSVSKFKFKFKCLFFKPHMEEYKKITVNVISKTYNITHNNVYIIIQSITVFSLHTF